MKSQISKEYEHLTDFYDQYKDVLTAGNTVESNYLLYRNYCETHNITPAKKLSFCKQMCRNFPIELMMKCISRETICRIWIGERKVKQ